MNWAERVLQGFRAILPSPFTIALILTAVTFLLAFGLTRPEGRGVSYALDLLIYWEEGIWSSALLTFAMQMMLMLVLGHILALTAPVEKLIDRATQLCTTSANSAAIVAVFTILVGFINWGLALIFGAIFARKVGEHAHRQNIPLNYPLIGAAGYAGMMVWHGGISGSSLVKVAENGHLQDLIRGADNPGLAAQLPDSITFASTVFSAQNILVSIALLVLVPTMLYWVGKMSRAAQFQLPSKTDIVGPSRQIASAEGAERLDYKRWLTTSFGVLIIGVAIYKALFIDQSKNLGFITPNFINFCLLGAGMLLHRNLHGFTSALGKAMGGASGILIQFPIYFGIMGIMNSSGLVHHIAGFFVAISNDTTYPVFTFLSAGLVNFFVPSGGGQWMVQGPIIIQAAHAIGVDLPKSIMALAYGDQITNMLQPFWALPLLGITGLKAKDLLPYTALMLVLGSAIFIVALLVW